MFKYKPCLQSVVFFLFVSICAKPDISFAENGVVTIYIKDHHFFPNQISIPSGQKIKLVIDNQDLTPEEFESYDLNREKVVSGKSRIIVFIGPLKKGQYKFFGEFHQQTAQGIITVE
jgi:hypothetical protein